MNYSNLLQLLGLLFYTKSIIREVRV